VLIAEICLLEEMALLQPFQLSANVQDTWYTAQGLVQR
jgi:hypothetical protein